MQATEMEPSGIEANPVALNAIMRASEKHLIVACEDIVDARGFKLWAKGQPVSASLQQKLLERRLERPLEACLTAQDGATLPFLQESMASFLSSPSALAQGLAPWAGPVQEHMQGLTWHSVVQLLCTTAMATRTSYIAHAVGAAALMGAMALSKKWPAGEVRTAMLAGLLHDIGEVYIQPAYLDSSDPLDLLGYKHLAVHPRMAQMLLASTTNYSPALCQAVGEHHERLGLPGASAWQADVGAGEDAVGGRGHPGHLARPLGANEANQFCTAPDSRRVRSALRQFRLQYGPGGKRGPATTGRLAAHRPYSSSHGAHQGADGRRGCAAR